jgi:hypothetical protein
VSVSSRQGTQGSEGGAAAGRAGSSNGTQPTGKHSHTPSFTTLIHDPSGFNLIEDYAQAAAGSPELAEGVPEPQQQQSGRKGRATSRSASPSKPQQQRSGSITPAATDGGSLSAPATSGASETLGGIRRAGAAAAANGADDLDGAVEFRIGSKRQQGTGSKSVGGWTPSPSSDNLTGLDSSLEEEADEVDAEVYEHERVQPFR